MGKLILMQPRGSKQALLVFESLYMPLLQNLINLNNHPISVMRAEGFPNDNCIRDADGRLWRVVKASVVLVAELQEGNGGERK